MHVRVASSFCNRCGGTSDVKVTFGTKEKLLVVHKIFIALLTCDTDIDNRTDKH